MKHIHLLLIVGVTVLALPWTDTARSQPTKVKEIPRSLDELSDSFEALVEAISPAVVQIFATGYGPVGDGVTTSGLIVKRRAGGSGVILHPDGYIITNAHVVDGARRVQVMLPLADPTKKMARSILRPRGRRVEAQIVGVDRETDLAVLKVAYSDLPYLELGDSDELRQGQIVLAFGSPYGLENSVSMGVVSSVSRQLTPEAPMIYIQTDATINPGNSGGPLTDTQGRVVGINTMIASRGGGSEGVGFAAPSNIVLNVYRQFRSSGRVRRGHIGVHAQTITATVAAGLGLEREWGVVLGDVYPGGPADRAGLRIGDVVLTLNGKTMENGRQFDVNLYRRPVGEEVTVEVERISGNRNFTVSVIERQDDPERFSNLVKPGKNLVPQLGILAVDVDDYTRRMLPPLRRDDGVVVAARAADAPVGDNMFLLPGDVIHMVNRTPVGSVENLRALLNGLQTGDAVVCQVERGGQLMFIALEIDI
ncbi:MAG: trypsin-like peptidase domain-containing protein [Candidatus Krumholzibacteria bacterium]|nr:trypsin-like peptidase domain-containing protein [Candidatus Krumholzibacteria bacterium]